jgi:hypothetical protein
METSPHTEQAWLDAVAHPAQATFGSIQLCTTQSHANSDNISHRQTLSLSLTRLEEEDECAVGGVGAGHVHLYLVEHVAPEAEEERTLRLVHHRWYFDWG